uniref:Uncharacterized protein n=1 Tax=Arundo donax TaxID=35708 RepID=A0A0A9BVS0_ARUDO
MKVRFHLLGPANQSNKPVSTSYNT